MRNIGLQLHSLRDDILADYDATLQAVSKMGYSSIEAASYADGEYYGREPETFKADLESLGLKPLSTHVKRELTETELIRKDFSEALKWWDTCIVASKQAGMSYIVMAAMVEPSSIGDLDTYCIYYNEVGRLANLYGLKFGYHNHAHEFKVLGESVIYDYLIEHTDPELVFFQMDVYWIIRGGASPVEYFHRYPRRFRLLHLRDHSELGESGMVGFDAILREDNLRVSGAEHLIIEMRNYSYAPKESVQKCYDYLCTLKK